MQVKYGISFKIEGEVQGLVPKEGYIVVTLNIEDNVREKAIELLSDAFDINCNRITIINFRKVL
jgi:hypothetical protein